MSPRGRLQGSIVQLAAVLGISQRSVRSMIAEGLPVAERGHGSRPAVFDIADACAWWRRKQKSVAAVSDGLERLRKARAEREERRNQEESGELVSFGMVKGILTQFGRSLQILAGEQLLRTNDEFRESWKAVVDGALDESQRYAKLIETKSAAN